MTIFNDGTKFSVDSEFSTKWGLPFGRTTSGRAVIVPRGRGVAVATWSDLAPYTLTLIRSTNITLSTILGTLVGHAHMQDQYHAWAVLFERPRGSSRSLRLELGELCRFAAFAWAEANDLELREAEFPDRDPYELERHRSTHWLRDSTRDKPFDLVTAPCRVMAFKDGKFAELVPTVPEE
jgi:hypothetical protein